MNNILAFDSIYMLRPLRRIYLSLVKKNCDATESKIKLILYRLDQDNVFLRDKRNLSGSPVGVHQEKMDALAIKFYQYLESTGNYHEVKMKDLALYDLYKRQVKLKLSEILKCAYRINKFKDENQSNLEVVTDRQTASIMKQAFLFLENSPNQIIWKEDKFLTICVTINSLLMRIIALIKMSITYSALPKKYFIRNVDSELPTVLIALPRRRPQDFLSSYVEGLNNKFNIILYSHGPFKTTPKDYEEKKIKRTVGFIKGAFNFKNLCFNYDSYITDILLIFKNHYNLSISIDVVNSIYLNKIDALINRQQTNVIDNYLAMEARRRKIFILGDIFEEIFFCDSAICSSESQNTESVKLALTNDANICFRGSNALIKYRLQNFKNTHSSYIKDLLTVREEKKLIFYASDPSKEESQRYLTELFLMNYFSHTKDYVLAVKTHTQDDGKITNYSYIDAGSPSNVVLIGDAIQSDNIVSKDFKLFNEFDFNGALNSSDGFLTSSSTSILQALVLKVKTGIVDKFNNGYYDYLVKYDATSLVFDEESLRLFLYANQKEIKKEVLTFCGLQNENNKFDLANHLLNCLDEFNERQKKYGEVTRQNFI